ncbi:hypothetical protein CSQ92_18460 [Janthinobacterium sp. BJB446]|uniref:AbiU2 domain-containing protein n=1 Tax=Janthinobacterium sp. BJB446 TaxID=2048009 RepID=UPI000C106383|nr:hypothetical protein [Janthinobacterium sp. BJB446]PHV21333.1 hypothetical protein CSQ92_18460 [Janthinobacterium sp. BJB446]
MAQLPEAVINVKEEVSNSRTSNVPTGFIQIYDELRSEITWLHGRWMTYRELFGENPRRIELLEECAGTFFYIIQDVLLDEVQISLSKLTDPSSIGKHSNLSLEQLQSNLQQHGEATLAANCRAILDKLHVQCNAFRVRRHKTLAHLDLLTALNQLPQPLPGVSRQMIEDALKSVREYMNAIEAHYNDSEWGYEHFILNHGAGALLTTLRAGLRYEELVQNRALPYDDWRSGKWIDA